MPTEALRFDIFAKDEFSKSFNKLKNQLPSLKTIALAAAGGISAVGASLFAMAKTTATAYDQVGKFAHQTGLTTEFLSSMNVAAEFADVNVNTMRKSVERLQIGIGEAAKGIGLAKDTLKDFGIELYKDNGILKTTEDILPELADKFQMMGSATERTEAAQKLFGQRGIEMIKILKDGSEGLKAYTDEAEVLGLVIDQQAAENAAKFNDALFKVKGALTGLKNEIGERVMPIITGLAEKFSDFVKNNRDRIIDFGHTVFQVMNGIVEKMAFGVGLIVDSWRGLQMTWETLRIGLNEFYKFFVSSINFFVEKSIALKKALNFRGIFDESIESSELLSYTLKAGIETLQESADVAREKLQALVNEGMATGKIDEFIQKAHIAIEEIKEAGTAELPEAAAEQGIIFNPSQFEREQDEYQKHIEEIARMHDEYFLSDQEKLDLWYAESLSKANENNEAMLQLQEIYYARQTELDEARQAKEKAITEMKIGMQAQAFGKIAAIGKTFGKNFFEWTKAASIAEATINTYLAATSAFAKAGGYPFGIFAAAASIAYGLAQVANISQQTYAAHGGMTNVPREQTMLLDKGERILSPNQNKDFTDFISGQGDMAASGVTIENINILPNATNAELLLELRQEDWNEIVENNILPALKSLDNRGYTIA